MNTSGSNEDPVTGRTDTTEAERDRARRLYGGDDIQIDDDARASRTDEGIWVQAWVWVPRPERGDE